MPRILGVPHSRLSALAAATMVRQTVLIEHFCMLLFLDGFLGAAQPNSNLSLHQALPQAHTCHCSVVQLEQQPRCLFPCTAMSAPVGVVNTLLGNHITMQAGSNDGNEQASAAAATPAGQEHDDVTLPAAPVQPPAPAPALEEPDGLPAVLAHFPSVFVPSGPHLVLLSRHTTTTPMAVTLAVEDAVHLPAVDTGAALSQSWHQVSHFFLDGSAVLYLLLSLTLPVLPRL